ncbi:MAG: NUDIX domain-containing protein [Candidatus Pelagadaptatus aseana]|uniref:NUDIX hydrolase n=1 Tax=Candidatus Pelagadaptatus aseana TaxID=3120508 RepID=UPI0039B1967F
MSDFFKTAKNTTSDQAPPAAPAATVILLREASESFEVLLLLRAKAIQFAGGNWVFPGGRIDPADYKSNPDDEIAAARVAAARESSEEAGLTLNSEEFSFFSHWTTPLIEKKRFSTWFLWSEISRDQSIVVDEGEIVDHLWVTPSDAIQMMRRKEIKILPPTFLTLYELAQCSNIDDVQTMTSSRELPRYFPNLVLHEKTPGILLENDSGYDSGDMDHNGVKQRVIMGKSGWEFIDET